MIDLKENLEVPSLLTEDELKSMPMAELLALVKAIGASSHSVVKLLKVNAENIKTIRDFVKKNKIV